jgi:DDE superfamily endonuclease
MEPQTRGPRLNEHEKNSIMKFREKGLTISAIAGLLDKPEGTISSSYARQMAVIDLPPRLIVKRTKISGAMGLTIKKIVADNPKRGLKGMVGLLKEELPNLPWYPSYKTIGRFLAENGNLRVNYQLKPPINATNKLKRFQFANTWLVDGLDVTGNVLWTDETMVRSHPFTRRISGYVHQTTAILDRPVQEKHHTGKLGVMFWGCISKHACGPLVVVEGSMDGPKYIEVLEQHLIPEIEAARLTIDAHFKLMHDNAPCHKSRLVTAYLAQKGVEFIEWPPYSPDMNPIENIWAWVKQKLYSEYPPAAGRVELIEMVLSIWDQITPELVQRYCGNYGKRLLALKNARGSHTKY